MSYRLNLSDGLENFKEMKEMVRKFPIKPYRIIQIETKYETFSQWRRREQQKREKEMRKAEVAFGRPFLSNLCYAV